MKFLHAVSLFLLFAVVFPIPPSAVEAATVAAVTYNVQVAPVSGGGGKIFYGKEDVSGGKTFAVTSGKSITLKMDPDDHFQVKEVVAGGVSKVAAKSVKVKVVDKDVDVSATFEKIPYKITAATATGGTINVPPGTTGTFGDRKTFTVTPDKANGYYLVDLKLDKKSIKVVNDTFTIDVTGNHKLSATFSNMYTIKASAGTGGSIAPKGTFKVRYGSSKPFTIKPLTKKGYFTSEVLVDGENYGPLEKYTFTPVWEAAPDVHTVAASFETEQHYKVEVNAGTGGSISPDGVLSIEPGETRSLTVAPSAGYRIGDVLVDGVSQGAVSSLTITGSDKNRTVSASFVRVHTVAATAEEGGTISPSGTVTVDAGASQEFTVKADAGYSISDVVVDGESKGSVATVVLGPVNGAGHTISASFTKMHPINVSASTGGSITPAGPVSVADGTSQTFRIAPAAGYRIFDVKVGGATATTSVGSVETYTFENVTGVKSIAATFLPVYTISATAGVGGSIAPAGAVTVDGGASQTFTVVAAEGYVIANVMVDEVAKGAVSAVSLGPVNEAGHIVTATFAKTYTIAASAGTGGSIAPSGAVTVTEGGSQTFSVTPGAGYRVGDVKVDNVSVGAVGSYSFSNVREAGHKIEATFVKTYTVTPTVEAGQGTISPSVITVDGGSSPTFTITPAANYRIDKVEVDGVDVGAVTSHTFTAISADHTVKAYFLPLHTIVVGVQGDGGRVVPPGPVTVSHGGSQSFLIVPDTGYAVSGVEVDGQSVGIVSSYTFSNVTTNDRSLRASFAILSYSVGATGGSGGTITPSGTLSADYGSSKQFTIAAAAGYRIKDVLVDGVSVGAVSSYSMDNITASRAIHAEFVAENPVTYAVSASVDAPGGGSISPAGVTTVAPGGTVTYSITPNDGYHVAAVKVDGVSVGAVDRYTLTGISGNRRISVLFELNAIEMKTLVATAGPGGVISPSGTITLPNGTSQSFIAVPSAGYRLDSITVDGSVVEATGPVTLTAGENLTIAATFASLTPPAHVVTVGITGEGEVTPADRVEVTAGAPLTLGFVPSAGYRVKGVTVDGVARGPVTTYTFAALTADAAVTVEFEEMPLSSYTVSAGAGPGGIVAPPGVKTVTNGATPTYTVVPDAGYTVAAVTVDGEPVTLTDGTYTFPPIHADKVLSVTFSAVATRTHTIIASAGEGGTISPSGGITVAPGTTRTFTITPAAGYRVADVTVEGFSVGAVTTYTVANIDRDYTIAARFEEIPPTLYTISVSPSAGGTTSPAGSITVAAGGDQKIVFIPNQGYFLTEVVVDGVARPEAVGAKEVTFSSVAANHTVSATFEPPAPVKHAITATVGGGSGTITPSGTTEVLAGYNQVYDIEPAPGYSLVDVLVDNISQGPVSSYVFMGVNAPHAIKAVFALLHNVTVDRNSGGSVTPDGTTSVLHGSSVTFAIDPAEGFVVETVTLKRGETTTSLGAVRSYTLTDISEDILLTVRFKQQFNIVATAGTGGTISPSGTQAVLLGGTATYTITPDSGYTIVDVAIDDVSRGRLSAYTFAANETYRDHTIHATFGKLYSVSGSVEGVGGTISPSGTFSVVEGGSATFSFTPNTGYYVRELVVDGVARPGAASYTFSSIAADHTVVVRFGKVYEVTSTAGTGGAISPAGKLILSEGSSQAYSITPLAGYTVQGVQVTRGGVTEQLGAVSSFTLANVTSEVSIAVTFVRVHVVEATKLGAGTISPAGKSTVVQGSSITYTVTPDPNNYLVKVEVDGVSQGAVTSVTISNVAKSYAVVAYFAPVHTIVATAGAGGTISPAGSISVLNGGSQTFVFTPDNEQTVVSKVIVDGFEVPGPPSEYTFSDATASHTIEVVFGQPQWKKATVRVSVAGNIGSTKIGSLLFTISVPAGVSAAVTKDLFLNGVAQLTEQTAGSFEMASEYSAASPGGPGTVTIWISSMFGFTVGEAVILNLDVAQGAFPKAGDFTVNSDYEVLDDSFPPALIAGASVVTQTSFSK